MAAIKELKDCPYGCPRSSRSIEVCYDHQVRCTVCGGLGPDAAKVVHRRYRTDTLTRQAAMHLWNARTTSKRDALVTVLSSGDNPKNYMAALDGEKRAADSGQRQWAECVVPTAGFTAGIEYAVVPVGVLEGVESVSVEDDGGSKHVLPAINFGLAT